MKKSIQQNLFEYETSLIEWLIRYYDTLPHEFKVKLADALSMKLSAVWFDESFKSFKPEWDKEIDDLRKTGWK